jgi:UDP-N-acetyl-2-amino-2-deoxyglucuronate dehydrogenase
MPLNFALLGAGGYIAPRHLRAIRDTGNRLVAAGDPHDAVGVLDAFAFDVKFFTEIERFDRHLEKLKRGPAEARVDWVSICTPNYLHDAHIRLALRVGANAICEKPLVISPWNLDQLQAIEAETGGHISTVLQLRVHPSLIALREKLLEDHDRRHRVQLTYITARGPWYQTSWKGDLDRGGGVAANIGIHFFDLLPWLFGRVTGRGVHLNARTRMSGFLELERADVSWFLSVDASDLPFVAVPGRTSTYRSITVDSTEVEFSDGFTDLHTRIYERTLAGQCFGIEDARPSIELAYALQTDPLTPPGDLAHPYLLKRP